MSREAYCACTKHGWRFVTRNCPDCGGYESLSEADFHLLGLWVACPDCRQPMTAGRVPTANYGFICERCKNYINSHLCSLAGQISKGSGKGVRYQTGSSLCSTNDLTCVGSYRRRPYSHSDRSGEEQIPLMMQPYKGYFIDGSAMLVHPFSPDRYVGVSIFVPGRYSSIVEITRFQLNRFTVSIKELAEWFGVEVARIVVDECLAPRRN
jgi:endogenous inhibitor of DNA gyrase (YacG/DUF329 family)